MAENFELLEAGQIEIMHDQVLELEPPHGFLMAQGKQTAIARGEPLDCDKAYLIEFDSDDWFDQHRVTQRERRQWWPDVETFYIYRVKGWKPFEGIKLYEDGKVVDEPRLTSEQWKIVSAAKELPKQIILLNDAVSVTDKQEFVIDLSVKCKELDSILSATYQTDVREAKEADELIPLYSLALVRNPRMRVSKKNIVEIEAKQEEGEDMPFAIRQREDEYCVVKINPDRRNNGLPRNRGRGRGAIGSTQD
jgi:hypothetical protein